MKIYKKALLTLFISLSTAQLYAHALWIETNTSGKVGQRHEVKIFYGEYALNEREAIDKWYSDVKDFTLQLNAPGKESIKLEKTANGNHYHASFIPDTEGIYYLTVIHEPKDLGGSTKYEFSAIATVTVGKATKIDLNTIQNALKVNTIEAKLHTLNSPVSLQTILNGQSYANKSVSVFSPQGWSKEFTTDENGIITFSPIWPGRYVVEASHIIKNGGQHHGKEYKTEWKGATSSFEVIQ